MARTVIVISGTITRIILYAAVFSINRTYNVWESPSTLESVGNLFPFVDIFWSTIDKFLHIPDNDLQRLQKYRGVVVIVGG